MYGRHSLQVTQELEVYQSLDFNPDEGIIFRIGIEPFGDDIKDLTSTSAEVLVEALTDRYRDTQDYTSIYCVAHELSRLAEMLREQAMAMEDSFDEVGRLYDVDLSGIAEHEAGLPE